MSEPGNLGDYRKLVLPGVGAYPNTMKRINESGLAQDIVEFAQSGKPVLGICLGMQILFESSYEFEETPGLGIEIGRIVPIETKSSKVEFDVKPRIGWCQIEENPADRSNSSTLLKGIKLPEDFYFVHSFKVSTPRLENVVAITRYVNDYYCAVYENENIFGTQFHPEKSGQAGLKLLKNFSKL